MKTEKLTRKEIIDMRLKQAGWIIGKIEVLKAKYQQSLQELENLYGSLSQRAFRGEMEVMELGGESLS